MAIIYCSSKMAKWLGNVQDLPADPPDYNTWNANLFKVNRKNWLMMVHNPTAYVLLFDEAKKAEMSKFDLWFYPRLNEQLFRDDIPPDLARLFPGSAVGFYRSNNNKRMIGILTYAISTLKYSIGYWNAMGLDKNLLEINSIMNKRPTGPGTYTIPKKEIITFLENQKKD